MPADSSQDRDRQIAESVEALSMLKDQICGMYAALVEKHQQQVKEAGRLTVAEDRLTVLIGGLPKDPITLASIVKAADRVEATATGLPEVVKAAIDELGNPVTKKFIADVVKPTSDIRSAAAAATTAAEDYSQAVRSATWKVVGVALLVSLVVASVQALFVAWWIPPLSEIQAQRAERDQLAAVVANFEKRGGRAKLLICDGHLCIRTDETKSTYNGTGTATGEIYRIIKGY